MTESQQTEEIKRYLFSEMSDEESDAHEEQYYDNAEYFNELVGLETDLIDRYTIGKLNGKDLQRFEKSLEKSPERRKKVAAARIFQNLIAEEKANRKTIAIAAPTFWEKLSEYFKISTSGLKLAAGTLVILLVCSAAFLLYRNWQKQNEYADIERQQRQKQELDEQKKHELQELEDQKRIDEQRRQNELINRQPENSNINAQLNTENRQIENEQRKKDNDKRQKQIDELENRRNVLPANSQKEKFANEELAVETTRIGTSQVDLIVGKIDKGKASVTVKLPKDNNYSSVEIYSNGEFVKQVEIAEGGNLVAFVLPQDKIENAEIDVQATKRNTRGAESIGKFRLKIKKKKK